VKDGDGFRSAEENVEVAGADFAAVGDGGGNDDVEEEAGEPGEKGGRSLTLVPAAPSEAWLVGCASVFARANQLFVAAIACRTAWRPLSSMPLPDPAASARLSPSESLSGVASEAAEAVSPTGLAEAGPAAEALDPFGLPISSAGNGTGAWLTGGEDGTDDEGTEGDEDEDEEAAGVDEETADVEDDGAEDEDDGTDDEDGADEDGADEDGAE
jgi:hypothetical protein